MRPGRGPGTALSRGRLGRSIVILCCAAALVGCAAPATRTASSAGASQHRRHRPPTRPERAHVEDLARGPSRALIERAVSDLRRLGFWRHLTRHLYVVRISARTGVVRIPDDGHLADALLTGIIDAHGSGALCDIAFFPAAMRQDLKRQARFRSEGRLPSPIPSTRAFWMSVLGHELAHCLPPHRPFRQRGEATARRWERRILRAAQRAT